MQARCNPALKELQRSARSYAYPKGVKSYLPRAGVTREFHSNQAQTSVASSLIGTHTQQVLDHDLFLFK